MTFLNPQELHAKYDERMFALTHQSMEDIIDGTRYGEYNSLLDEIGAFGFEPVEIFTDDGTPSYFGYRKLKDESRRIGCIERYAVNHLHGLRSKIQFAFRHEPETVEGRTRSTLVVVGIPEESKEKARKWLQHFLDGFSVSSHIFDIQLV